MLIESSNKWHLTGSSLSNSQNNHFSSKEKKTKQNRFKETEFISPIHGISRRTMAPVFCLLLLVVVYYKHIPLHMTSLNGPFQFQWSIDIECVRAVVSFFFLLLCLYFMFEYTIYRLMLIKCHTKANHKYISV